MRKKTKSQVNLQNCNAQLLSKFLRERELKLILFETRTDSPHSYFGVQFNWKQLLRGEKTDYQNINKINLYLFTILIQNYIEVYLNKL